MTRPAKRAHKRVPGQDDNSTACGSTISIDTNGGLLLAARTQASRFHILPESRLLLLMLVTSRLGNATQLRKQEVLPARVRSDRAWAPVRLPEPHR